MDVVLLQNIRNVGRLGEVVSVKPGFGRNYLIPQGKAMRATKDSVAEFEAKRAEYEKLAGERIGTAEKRAASFSGVTISIAVRAGDEGKLYGSIGPREIAKAANDQGHELEKSEVTMPAGPIREVGEHQVDLHLHSDVMTQLKVVVESEK